jgi:hypothetical protein
VSAKVDVTITYPELIAVIFPTRTQARAAQRDAVGWLSRRHPQMAVDSWHLEMAQGCVVAVAMLTVWGVGRAVRRRLERRGGRAGRLPERLERELRLRHLATLDPTSGRQMTRGDVEVIWTGDGPPPSGELN